MNFEKSIEIHNTRLQIGTLDSSINFERSCVKIVLHLLFHNSYKRKTYLPLLKETYWIQLQSQTYIVNFQTESRAFHPLQNPPILQNRPAGKAFSEILKFLSTTTNLLTFSFGTLPLSSSSWVLCSKLLIISDETIIYFLFFLLGYRIYRVSNYDQMNF